MGGEKEGRIKEGGGQDERGEMTEGAWVWAKGSDVLVTMMGRVGLEIYYFE